MTKLIRSLRPPSLFDISSQGAMDQFLAHFEEFLKTFGFCDFWQSVKVISAKSTMLWCCDFASGLQITKTLYAWIDISLIDSRNLI